MGGDLNCKHAQFSNPKGDALSADGARIDGDMKDAVIRVYDESGNVIATHEHKGDFKER